MKKAIALTLLGILFFVTAPAAMNNGNMSGAFLLVSLGVFSISSAFMLTVWIPLFRKLFK